MLSGFSNAAVQGLAIADAGGIAELPLIGRLLQRHDQPAEPSAVPASGAL